jgi:outer membrane protein
MKHTRLHLVAVLAIAALIGTARADSTPWTVRVRGTYLSMANKSDAFSALGLNFPADAVTINSKFIPELDISYSFSDHWAAELVLTVPQTQDVTLKGVGALGTFKHLPPVLAAQYHFLPGTVFDPYIGAGVNYTLIYDNSLKVTTVPLHLDSNSVGIAGQVGADINLGQGIYLNFDVKKVTLNSGVYVSASGAKLTTATLDPWLLSAGLGIKF